MSGYVQTLVFPCGRCNWPICETFHSPKKLKEEDFSGRKIDLKCPRCEWEGAVFGAQAELFQPAEWNLEIHFGLHIDKPKPGTVE